MLYKLSRTSILIFLFSIFIVSGFAQKSAFRIIETQSGEEVSFNYMMHQLRQADIIFLGEEHNDSIAHLVELKVLQALYYQNRGKLSLSMEMWERDVQGIMNEYLLGFISEKNFIKESRAWGNYADYRPLIEFAKKEQIHVICANTPARYTNMVTRGGFQSLYQLPKSVRKNYLPDLPIDTLKGRYYEKFLEVLGGHGFPGMHLYQSQNLWDATMAYSILEALNYDPFQQILHINGKFHSDEYLGVAARVLAFDAPRYKVKTISCNSFSQYIPEQHRGIADFVILTQ